MTLEIGHRHQEGIEVFGLHGRIVFGESDLVLRNEIDAAVAAGTTRVVFDLARVSDIDTTGLGTLLFAQAELKKAGGGLALASLHPAHMALLVVAKMERSFEVFERDQDAINSFFPDRKVRHVDIDELLEVLRQAK